MSLQRNYYEVLGVPHGATTDEIKKKYRDLARKFHPDVVKDKVLGQKVFSQINQAYRVLSDPDRRAVYDTTLEAETMGRVAAGTASRNPTNGFAAARPYGTNGNGSNGNGGSAASRPSAADQLATITRLLSEADMALMQGKPAAARTSCEEIIKIDPQNVKALGLLGDALALTGQPQEAAKAYQRALQITPSRMLQEKLSRVSAAPAMNGAKPASAPLSNGNGVKNGATPPPAAKPADAKPTGGLLGRFLGKK